MERFEPNMLNGYITYSYEDVSLNNRQYRIQYFQEEHQDEYLICEYQNTEVNGSCELYCSGMLVQSWEEVHGRKQGLVRKYEQGVLKYVINWKDVFGYGEFRCFENTPQGLRLIIVNRDNGVVVYRGEYDSEEFMKRVGSGFSYDRETGDLRSYGIYRNDSLFQIIHSFTKDGKMITFQTEDGISNVEIQDRYPIYSGGCCYCEEDGIYVRDGVGYVLDKSSGIATSEEVWNRGIQGSRRKLYNGLYKKEGESVSLRQVLSKQMKRQLTVKQHSDLSSLSSFVTQLVVDENCCNEEDIMTLELSGLAKLQSLVIKSYNFANTYRFTVFGCNELSRVEIGDCCFCHWKGPKELCSRDAALSISNCKNVSSISVGCHSFVDYIHCSLVSRSDLRGLA